MGQSKAVLGIGCITVASALVLGCQKPVARIPAGCYYRPGGDAFLIVRSDKLVLLVPDDVRSSAIGPWIDRAGGRFKVSPGFYIHDGTASPPKGPAVMSQSTPTSRSGSLVFRHVDNQDIVSVPVEAYGYLQLVRGNPCPEAETLVSR